MAKKKNVGLRNADEETKKMVSDLGHEAQGHEVAETDEDYVEIPRSFEQTNMDIDPMAPAENTEDEMEEGETNPTKAKVVEEDEI